MSRALEPGTEALPHDNAYSIFTDIVKALDVSNHDALLEIEMLGKSHPLPPGCNVLTEGKSIGIPKAKLVQAFVVGRQTLFKHMRSSLAEWETVLRDATAIVILMDPEHLTAANTRKRVLQIHQNRPESEYESVLNTELRFVDSYLTSRLHRHTKSPTLWNHRRWLIEQFQIMGFKYDIRAHLTSVILVAAERHPRNYYAWSHLRWLVQRPRSGLRHAGDIRAVVSVSEYESVLATVKGWALNHPADTSGFSFMLFCLTMLNQESGVQRGSAVCQEVLRRTASFQWYHESVWVFLRTLAASHESEKQDSQEFLRIIDAMVETHPDATRFLVAARDWCKRYEAGCQA